MHDALVIGAGAAGLAAAAHLRSAGLDFLILEARDRAGGRCLSIVHSAAPVPLELGAEFVHGAAAETERLAARAGVPIIDIAGQQWLVRGRRLQRRDDFWKRVGRVLSRLPDRHDDVSFDAFLASKPGGRTLAEDRRLARAFVQGFHAADVSRASTRALAQGGNPGEDEDAARHGRTVGGYTSVLAALLHDVADRVRFGAHVRSIRWQRGHVVVNTDTDVFEARTAIITLPLGVLQSDAVMLDPLPPSLARALTGLAMGSVARVTLLFEQRFWEKDRVRGLPRNASLTDLSFLHTPDSPFNIWWTLHPLRAPVIVGWSGGPPAAALEREGAVEQRAVTELASRLGIPPRRLDAMLVASFHHDWDADPYSRGAYSYAVVGGATAGRRLARPIEDTIYMAGEATAGADSGTVEGAIKSGYTAARRILDGLT